ncbi:hypothetical protein C2845_PM11G03130 [Panicum miliaceum]|uniref:Uncharacterized protein n=1 Tax=Panicum miliaceum TaxID=4540 RepID=A0A3L6RVC8_PANMI|nr:hypothetical protein C2845_PM11G03130 [Panicum miliaceum]
MSGYSGLLGLEYPEILSRVYEYELTKALPPKPVPPVLQIRCHRIWQSSDPSKGI